MARNDGIDRTSARNVNLTATKIGNAQRHNEREKESYTNPDIIPERTPQNIHFKKPTAGYAEMFAQMEQDGIISTRGLKSDANLYGELIFDVNSAYFYNHGGYEFAKRFYEDAYKAAIEIVGGEQYILSAVMHADERNRAMSEALGQDVFHYHLHVVYVPVVEKQILWSKRCKDKSLVGTVKETIMQVSSSKKWLSKPALDEQGRYVYYNRQYGYQQTFKYNILNELDHSYSHQDNSSVMLTANLRYKATDWLSMQAVFSYSTSNTEQENYLGEQTWYAASLRKSNYGELPQKGDEVENTMPYGGELRKDYTRNNSYTARLQMDISKYFGKEEQHNISANLGYEVNSSKYVGFNRTDRGYYADRGKQFSTINLDDFPYYKDWVQNNVPTISDNLTNMISGYISMSYSYKNYFTLNANTRIDGSNQFGSRSNEKLLPVWSVSGAYNISEHFDIDNKWVNNLALRLSYGYQGNMLNGQSPEMIIKKEPFDTHYNELTSSVSIYPNPDLRWERTSSFNAGLDFSLFNNAVQMNTSYYYKHTKDAFLTKKISSVNGRNEYVVNSGTINNQGFSIDATVSPISNENFRWTLSASYSKVFNEMNTKPEDEQYELEDFLTGNALTKGNAVSTFWSYKFIGFHPQNGGPVFDDMQDRKQELMGLSKYDTYTMVLTPSGQRDPKAQGSITSTFRYKSFRLNFILNYSFGSKIRLFGLYDDGLNFDPEKNVNYEMVNRWRNPGDENHTNIPNIINGSDPASQAYALHWSRGLTGIQMIAENAWTMYDNSDHRVVSGDYLKCSNMSLSYDVPVGKLEKYGISMLTATLSTTNLFDISSKKLKGQTPIQSGFSNTQLSERPTWSLSLSVSF